MYLVLLRLEVGRELGVGLRRLVSFPSSSYISRAIAVLNKRQRGVWVMDEQNECGLVQTTLSYYNLQCPYTNYHLNRCIESSSVESKPNFSQ